MWGYRVIVPGKFRKQLLSEIHGAHNGMVKMKALARQYFWWPKLDAEIEDFVKNCNSCMTYSKNPNKVPLIKFEEGKQVFDRIHVDFLGPVKGKTFLIITDAYSKWPEVYEMTKMDSITTIDKLRDCFARYGLPNTIISDNGPQLVSTEFEHFCTTNGIKHTTSPPYHPATNGAAENSVKTFKSALNKLLMDSSCYNLSISALVSKYLFSYRNTPHCVTGETPSKLMFLRKVKTRLDFLSRSAAEKARENQIKFHHGNRNVNFEEGELVYTKDYRNVKPKWVQAKIVRKIGRIIYMCQPVSDSNLQWKRNADRIVKVGKFYEEVEVEKEDSFQVNRNLFRDFKGENVKENEVGVIFKEVETEQSIDREAKDVTGTPVAQTHTKENVCILSQSPLTSSRPRRVIKPPDRLDL